MPPATHSSSANLPSHNPKVVASKPKKLPAAAVEATALAFVAGFKALPGAVQWRVVQLLEAYEEELAEAHDAADMAANPENYSRENAVPWEQVKAELADRAALHSSPQQHPA